MRNTVGVKSLPRLRPQDLRSIRWTCVALRSCFRLVCFFSGGQDQMHVPILHPELIAGPWETVSASGIDGVFLQFVTSSSGPSGSPQIAWQTVDIRVYHRQENKETSGWFTTTFKAGPESSDVNDDHTSTRFDGQRPRINFTGTTDLKPFDLDIGFSPSEQIWTGTWSHSGGKVRLVLSLTPGAFISGSLAMAYFPLGSTAQCPAWTQEQRQFKATSAMANFYGFTLSPAQDSFWKHPMPWGLPITIAQDCQKIGK